MKIAASGSRCTRLARGSFAAAFAASAGLGSASCGPGVATPVPEPPTLRLDHVGPAGKDSNPQPAANGTHIYGSPGAAPVGAIVRVTNLDGKAPPSVANVVADGSFDVVLNVVSGQELRFDWLRGSERGAPQDAHFVVDAPTFHLEPSARFACVRLTPGFAVDFGITSLQTLVLGDDCAATVSLSGPRSRLGLPDFTLATALPLDVAPSGEAALSLSFRRSQTTAREDTLFFDVSNEGTIIRYPITLSAPASP